MLSNPKDRQVVSKAIQEMSNSFTRIQSEKDLQKDIIARVSEEVGIDKKQFKILSKLYYKQSLVQVKTETDELVELYESLFN